MGNPWAPPDHSAPPGQPTPGQALPGAPGGAARPPSDAPPPAAPGGRPAPGGPGAPVPPGGPAGPVPPGGPGPRPVAPPDPAGVARTTRTAAWSAACLLVAVLLVSAPYPALLLAPVASLAGLVLAILAVVRAVRARARGPVVALSVVLVVSSVAWTGVSAQSLLYVDARRDYQECRAGALTQQAQRGCSTQLEQDMEDRVRSITGFVGTPPTSA
ncbi:hypothetical protein [Cellulomonas sp. S1-8]|uniref:hypothetical protein n=1 Tax=Cellulomonas sp. S1-8 TaxID=2904790 RepID=UPI00224471A7|nr:hypothetical protein [Cellulomonas sp. S1-8]UZN02123.1 hypothetical protein OKX07_13635 [Cellulomonas sp. S1-8]